MRIISEFKDYYDSVQPYVRGELPYVRKTSIKVVKKRHAFAGNSDMMDFFPGLGFFEVHFCGKTYTGYSIDKICAYDIESLDSLMENVARKNERKRLAPNVWSVWAKTYLGTIKKHKNYSVPDILNRKLIKERLGSRRDASPRNCPIILFTESAEIDNPNLSRIGFQKVVDPYSAYQEIDMWLSNQANPEPVIPKIDDETMAFIKGFNKQSFRKRKQ